MPTDFLAVFTALMQAQVRFVVAGGLAVVLHGHDRLTADIDIAMDLTSEPVQAAVSALTRIGYRPLAPVDAMELADAERRTAWRQDRRMQVFSFWDTTNTKPTIDIFIEPPIHFEDLWRDAVPMLLGGVTVRVASVAHLIRMKQTAGRPQDLADIERLRSHKQE